MPSEARQDPNAREAARRMTEALKRPDRRVGAALMPKKRGGVSEWQAVRRCSSSGQKAAGISTTLFDRTETRASARPPRGAFGIRRFAKADLLLDHPGG